MDHLSQDKTTQQKPQLQTKQNGHVKTMRARSLQEITNRLERLYQLSQNSDLLPQGIANLPDYFSSLWGGDLRKERNLGVKVDVRVYHTVRGALQKNRLQLRH